MTTKSIELSQSGNSVSGTPSWKSHSCTFFWEVKLGLFTTSTSRFALKQFAEYLNKQFYGNPLLRIMVILCGLTYDLGPGPNRNRWEKRASKVNNFREKNSALRVFPIFDPGVCFPSPPPTANTLAPPAPTRSQT